jgi:hypothetical protein
MPERRVFAASRWPKVHLARQRVGRLDLAGRVDRGGRDHGFRSWSRCFFYCQGFVSFPGALTVPALAPIHTSWPWLGPPRLPPALQLPWRPAHRPRWTGSLGDYFGGPKVHRPTLAVARCAPAMGNGPGFVVYPVADGVGVASWVEGPSH